jgi:hypothetical protein
MDIEIHQIDAFTDTVFGGNPAAVCPLDGWLNDDQLLAIAGENNLSETAFIVAENDGQITICAGLPRPWKLIYAVTQPLQQAITFCVAPCLIGIR